MENIDENQPNIFKHQRLSLWLFLYELLQDQKTEHLIAWEETHNLIFKIKDGHKVAKAWGRKKGRDNMTYPKFLRALRYYYGKNILEKVQGMKNTYRFLRSNKTMHVFPPIRSQTSKDRRKSLSLVEDIISYLDSPMSSTSTSSQNNHVPSDTDTVDLYWETFLDNLCNQTEEEKQNFVMPQFNSNYYAGNSFSIENIIQSLTNSCENLSTSYPAPINLFSTNIVNSNTSPPINLLQQLQIYNQNGNINFLEQDKGGCDDCWHGDNTFMTADLESWAADCMFPEILN